MIRGIWMGLIHVIFFVPGEIHLLNISLLIIVVIRREFRSAGDMGGGKGN